MTITGGGLFGLILIILLLISILFIYNKFIKRKKNIPSIDPLIEDYEDDIEELEINLSVRIPKEAKVLFEEGFSFYPHKNTEKALSCFLNGLKLISSAPSDRKTQIEIDGTDIGHASWAAWVCMDMLEKSNAEIDNLFNIIRAISPITLQRIEEQLSSNEIENDYFKEIEECAPILNSVGSYDEITIDSTINTLIKACEGTNAFWKLKDYGITLYKQGKKEIAWKLFDKALSVAKNYGGNTTPIYNAIGQILKSENNYRDAAKYFLMACIYSGANPPKTSLDNLRISLKKALPSEDPLIIMNILISKIGKEEPKLILNFLEGHLNQS